MSASTEESALDRLASLLAGEITDANVSEIKEAADEAVKSARANTESNLLTAQDLARALELRGDFLRITGEFDEAKTDYFEALSLFLSARNAEEAIGRVSTGLAVIHDTLDETDQARTYYEKAIESFEQTNPPAALDIADLSNNLAFIYEQDDQRDKAEELLLTSLKTCHQVLGPDHEQTALLYNNVGTLYFKSGHDDRAREMHIKGLEIRTRVFGSVHPETSQSHGNLALVFVRSGELNAAKRHFGKALDGLEQDLANYREDYDTIVANYRDVLESAQDRKALMQLEHRLL